MVTLSKKLRFSHPRIPSGLSGFGLTYHGDGLVKAGSHWGTRHLLDAYPSHFMLYKGQVSYLVLHSCILPVSRHSPAMILSQWSFLAKAVTVAVVLALAYHVKRSRDRMSKLPLPPGPKPHWLFGNELPKSEYVSHLPQCPLSYLRLMKCTESLCSLGQGVWSLVQPEEGQSHLRHHMRTEGEEHRRFVEIVNELPSRLLST